MAHATTLPRNEDGLKTAIGVLKQRFGERLQTGQSIREQHGHTTTWIENQPPDAVVFTRSTDEVSDIMRIATEHRVPIIPFGTGTSLEGFPRFQGPHPRLHGSGGNKRDRCQRSGGH